MRRKYYAKIIQAEQQEIFIARLLTITGFPITNDFQSKIIKYTFNDCR